MSCKMSLKMRGSVEKRSQVQSSIRQRLTLCNDLSCSKGIVQHVLAHRTLHLVKWARTWTTFQRSKASDRTKNQNIGITALKHLKKPRSLSISNLSALKVKRNTMWPKKRLQPPPASLKNLRHQVPPQLRAKQKKALNSLRL